MIESIPTEFGEVHKKISTGYGVRREKYEYEDIARIAREQEMSLADVTACIGKQEKKAWMR